MKRKPSKKKPRHLKLVHSQPVKKPVTFTKSKITRMDVFIIGLLLGSIVTITVMLW